MSALEYLARVRDDPMRAMAALRALYAAGLIEGDEPIAIEISERVMDLAARRGRVERVLAAREPVRHDGLAVTAVVVRSDATDVLFHHVGPHGGTLPAPALTDDVSTRYVPADYEPVSASGRFGAVTVGTWRYVPAAPAEARRFTIGDSWIVG